MKNTTRLLVFFTMILFVSCQDDEVSAPDLSLKIGAVAPDYGLHNGLPVVNTTTGIQNTNQAVHLGRVLFYDRQLSASSTVSCGSCHVQAFAFADPFRHSVGLGSQLSERNTPTIINTVFGQGLFWDQSATDLRDLITRPIQNHKEMGFSNLDALAEKLEGVTYYNDLFKLAYGDEEITKERIGDALTLFVAQLNSFDSRSDEAQLNADILSPLEQQGMHLFEEKGCNGCHQVTNNGSLNIERLAFPNGDEIFIGYTGAPTAGSTANIGLNTSYTDQGVGHISNNATDNGKFKIPTLRNIALTPPYMHDGRFATLHDVLDFYDSGVAPHPNLDDRLKDESGFPKKLNLTLIEKHAIVAFLGTLTSKDILSDERWSDPF